MTDTIIMMYDGENFESSCISGFKIVLKKISDITLDKIKQVRDGLAQNGYCVENFKFDDNRILEVEGQIDESYCINSIHELVHEVEGERKSILRILYKINFYDIELSLKVSGLY